MSNIKVVKYDEGPFVIQGQVELVDGKGDRFTTGETIALCRCGQSGNQPFCDGTHKSACYREASPAR
ncbi:CDGSH iron-sulfur domain-containing protein [Paenibacillus sp. HJGM_3]|uniref:CDGSH iron-sulfur domain-containing protein n=1 Tax=Paenibacillus sp. HJGM_3 TaxID=3379816 RepID=UPI003859BC1C